MDIDETQENDADDEDAASVKTVDLKPSHLNELELRALRRRMKKSSTWIPKQVCIKKELQTYGRWPLHAVSPEKVARRKIRLAKIKRRRQRQLKVIQKERVLAARRAREQAEKLKAERLKEKKQEVRYTMPVAANEPTYCYCGDVSYGEMIACENEVSPVFKALTDCRNVRGNGFIWSVPG
jgi:hypothetical protein